MTPHTPAAVAERLAQAMPQHGDFMVDTVSGRTLIWLVSIGNSFNPHCMGAARLKTLEGWYWTKRIRQLRRPMPGEVRQALRVRALPLAEPPSSGGEA